MQKEKLMENSNFDINVIIPMYNKENSIANTILSISCQRVSTNHNVHITIVNDASTDNSAQVVKKLKETHSNLDLLEFSENQGRSAARNLGFLAKKSDICIFIDADCTWQDNNTLSKFIEAFSQGAKACFGVVSGEATDFWGNYYSELNKNRALDPDNWSNITTANFACRTDLLRQTGGFSELYKHYGFEDRDLLLSLRKCAKHKNEIMIAQNIVVINNDRPCLEEIITKMRDAGRFSSGIFKQRFSQAYQTTPHSKIDIRDKSAILVKLFACFIPFTKLLISIMSYMFTLRIMNFTIKKYIVKLCSALSFSLGTYYAMLDQKNNDNPLKNKTSTHHLDN